MRLFNVILSSLSACVLSLTAVAQDAPPVAEDGKPASKAKENQGQGQGKAQGQGQGQPSNRARTRLVPEEALAAWQAQAEHVASQLGLDGEQYADIIAAYTNARQEHASEMQALRREMATKRRELRDEAENSSSADPAIRELNAQVQESFRQMNEKFREQLRSELTKSLQHEQVNHAMKSLGTFNPTWDVMTHALIGYSLGVEQFTKAMDATQKFVVDMDTALKTEDRQASAETRRQARKELRDTMKQLVSEKQFGQFQRILNPGRGRGQGGQPGQALGVGGEAGEGGAGGQAGQGGGMGGNAGQGGMGGQPGQGGGMGGKAGQGQGQGGAGGQGGKGAAGGRPGNK